MAITTIAAAVEGMRNPEILVKTGTAPEAAGAPISSWYFTGRPTAGAAPSPGVNGAAVTAPVTGQITRVNPASGNAYLARLGLSSLALGTWLLCDRLWHNSGLSITSTAAQAITPAAIPARDLDGTTNGNGVMAGLEVSTVTGAGTPTCTLTYTDSGGTAGNTVTFAGLTTTNVGTMYLWPLAAGDLGVRSCEQYQQSATWTSGAIHIILFRVIAQLEVTAVNIPNYIDFLTGGGPRIYDSSVPFFIFVPNTTTSPTFSGQYLETQG